MMTTSHAFFTYAAVDAGSAALAVLGSVLPDIPFWLGPPVVALQRRTWQGSLDATKDHPLFGVLLRLGHSAVVWAVAALLCAWFAPAWMPLIWGWAGHWVSDLVTHHGEPHAHLYPLSGWKFASPISYYEWEHHAAAFMAGEALVAGVILTGWYWHEPMPATLSHLIRQPVVLALVVGLLVLVWHQAYYRRRQPAVVAFGEGMPGVWPPRMPTAAVESSERAGELTGLAGVD